MYRPINRNGNPLLRNGSPLMGNSAKYSRKGLLARWDFNDTLIDSYNNYVLTLADGSIIYSTNRKEGTKSLYFDGSTYFNVPTELWGIGGPGPPNSPFTINWWMNVPSTSPSTGYVNTAWSISYAPVGTDNSRILANNVLFNRMNQFYDSNRTAVLNGTPSANTWTMYTARFDGTTMKFQSDNGGYSGTASVPGNYYTITPLYFWLGRDWYSLITHPDPDNAAPGLMIDVMYIYDRWITDEEVGLLWNSGRGG